MNCVYRLFIVFLFGGVLLCGCGEKKIVSLSDIKPLSIPEVTDSIIEIKNWLALGPFEFDTIQTQPSESFFIDDLIQYGMAEGAVDGNAIKELQKQGVNGFLIKNHSASVKMFDYVQDSKENKSHFYLVTKIKSPKEQEAAFIIDGSHSYSVWLNGEKLVEVRGKFSCVKTGDRFVNVSLKKGDNTVFVKINRGTNMISWDLIFNLSSRQTAKRIFLANFIGDFVVNPIVNDSLMIYAGPYLNGRVEALDANDQTVVESAFENRDTNQNPLIVSGLNGLDEGFYKTRLTVEGRHIEEMIYKGDFDRFVSQTKLIVDDISESGPSIDDLKAAFLLARYSSFHESYRNRLKTFWGYSFSRMFQQDTPPTRIMTYRDEKDIPREFIFHVRPDLKQNIPLVIIVPHALNDTVLIRDWYIRHLDQIVVDNALADQYGFGMAWIYAGGKNYSAEKTNREISAVLNRLNSEYDIDNRHIFLLGTCEGARRALIQLALSPERYAACAVLTPVTLFGGTDGIPINLIPSMGRTPIIIKHGAKDDHTSVENSRRFVAKAKKHGLLVEYIEPNVGSLFISNDCNRFAFEFFKTIVKSKVH